jgi:glycosyltransferase involved in cell wall biosynthesis
VAAGEVTSRRRLLLLSWFFPPAAAAGSLRWQKLAGHLAAAGWGLDVITVSPDAIERPDLARLEDLPPGTQLYGVQPRLPAVERIENALWRQVKRLRPRGAGAGSGSAAVPRPDLWLAPEAMRWRLEVRAVRRAYHAWLGHHREGAFAADVWRIARRLLQRRRYDVVVTCGPPHMVHEAGRRASRHFGLPLVMDLRDPWSLPRRLSSDYASPVWFALARRHEARCVAAAAAVITNTEEVRAAMAARDPRARVRVVMNGYDDAPSPVVPAPPFTITYAGAIYLDRDPRPLFRAVRATVDALGLDPARLRVRLVGDVAQFGGASTAALADTEGVGPFVELVARQPLAEVRRLLATSAVLVSLPQDSPWAVPSKVFEYMPYRSWILALAGRGSPTARLLHGTGADVHEPDDVAGIAATLCRRFEQFERGERADPAAFARFSRTAQAALLISELERATGVALPT